MVKEFHADGGLIITSSHNPIEWNGPHSGAMQSSLTDTIIHDFCDA